MIKAGVIGGLGLMASPMARHWKKGGPVQVLRAHDRGNPGERRERARAEWKAHGAALTPSLDEMAGADVDGIFVCAGKNGDDLAIIARLARQLAEKRKDAFICHLSTVSCGFARAAQEYCAGLGVQYGNYPLTGGPSGAEKATMLILASGERKLFDRLEPALTCLGTPRYFGEEVAAGAAVKFIGHLMVFGGLIGITSALAVQAECFEGGKLGGGQAAFFDFLNGGAGGTRQWDVIASAGIRNNVWDAPFQLRYAAVDAVYVAELCMQRKVSALVVESVFNTLLAFAYVLNHVDESFATHAIVREMVASRAAEFDAFLLKHAAPRGDLQGGLKNCIDSLPPAVRKTVALDINVEDFKRNL